jgi:hypothetical protein
MSIGFYQYQLRIWANRVQNDTGIFAQKRRSSISTLQIFRERRQFLFISCRSEKGEAMEFRPDMDELRGSTFQLLLLLL